MDDSHKPDPVRPLDYRGTRPPAPPGNWLAMWSIGMAAGTGAFALVWYVGRNATLKYAAHPAWWVAGVLFVKVMISATLLSSPRWRGLAAGLIGSIATGALIFGLGLFKATCGP